MSAATTVEMIETPTNAAVEGPEYCEQSSPGLAPNFLSCGLQSSFNRIKIIIVHTQNNLKEKFKKNII